MNIRNRPLAGDPPAVCAGVSSPEASRTPPTYLSPDEAAAFVRGAKKTIVAAIKSGELPALRPGRSFSIATEDLLVWARRRASRAQRPKNHHEDGAMSPDEALTQMAANLRAAGKRR
jgi:excisionase family DNA binding protein